MLTADGHAQPNVCPHLNKTLLTASWVAPIANHALPAEKKGPTPAFWAKSPVGGLETTMSTTLSNNNRTKAKELPHAC